MRFRKAGFQTYLAGIPWSEDFMRQYAAALDGVTAQASNIGAERTVAGSVNSVGTAYLDCSPKSTSPFKTAKSETQRTRRNILENFRTAHGDKPLYRTDHNGERVMLLKREHMQRIVNEKLRRRSPSATSSTRSVRCFNGQCWRAASPITRRLASPAKRLRPAAIRLGRKARSERFEGTHVIGTKARLAFALLLYTGQRRGDVVKLGRQHVHGDVLIFDQSETEGGEKAHLEIPLHPKLRAIIDATPTVGVKTFLVTHFGKPYTAPGFGNWFRELCDAAGCPDVSAHGLRKATARRLAEIGCTEHQIAAITGHASLSEVQRYAKAADRKRMARDAMAKLIEGGW